MEDCFAGTNMEAFAREYQVGLFKVRQAAADFENQQRGSKYVDVLTVTAFVNQEIIKKVDNWFDIDDFDTDNDFF